MFYNLNTNEKQLIFWWRKFFIGPITQEMRENIAETIEYTKWRDFILTLVNLYNDQELKMQEISDDEILQFIKHIRW